MRNIADTLHGMDDKLLVDRFKDVAPFSPDDEFIQMLLKEIKKRNISIEEVLRDLYLQ